MLTYTILLKEDDTQVVRIEAALAPNEFAEEATQREKAVCHMLSEALRATVDYMSGTNSADQTLRGAYDAARTRLKQGPPRPPRM